METVHNVLFLCTGNSARSVMAEVLLNYWGRGRFKAFSAGSKPKGQVHPMTLETLERSHLPAAGLRSKSWDEFSRPGAPKLDFVFTVCGNAAREATSESSPATPPATDTSASSAGFICRWSVIPFVPPCSSATKSMRTAGAPAPACPSE